MTVHLSYFLFYKIMGEAIFTGYRLIAVNSQISETRFSQTFNFLTCVDHATYIIKAHSLAIGRCKWWNQHGPTQGCFNGDRFLFNFASEGSFLGVTGSLSIASTAGNLLQEVNAGVADKETVWSAWPSSCFPRFAIKSNYPLLPTPTHPPAIDCPWTSTLPYPRMRTWRT